MTKSGVLIKLMIISLVILFSNSIIIYSQDDSNEAKEKKTEKEKSNELDELDKSDDVYMSDDDFDFEDETSPDDEEKVERETFTPDTFKIMEIKSYGKIELRDKANKDLVNEGYILYKANYKKSKDKTADKVLESVEIHDKYGMRTLIMLDDMQLIFKRVIFELNDRKEYKKIQYIESYTSGVLTSREFFDKKNRPDHFVIYTYVSNLIALQRKDDYIYDDTYGYYGIDVTNRKGNLIEKERFDSNGNRLYLKRYKKENGKNVEHYYNRNAQLVATKYFDDNNKAKRQDFFDRQGNLKSYRIYYYNSKGKKVKIVNFNKDGEMFEVLRYNNYGRLRAREKYKDGKLINSVKYTGK